MGIMSKIYKQKGTTAKQKAEQKGNTAAQNGGAAHRDKPWLIRTYSGHSSAVASNRLYRENLQRGQTGLSVAFDLPTQTGYDSDHPLAVGEVGKVGVPICHLGDMRTLFDGIPLEQMNTSMTINAPAAWLLALYVVAAEKQGADPSKLKGTTQNDIIKEYLSRGTYIFPPSAGLKLTSDVMAYTARKMPKWNPINICSYHLQEAGAGPVEELAFALANAKGVLAAVREKVAAAEMPRIIKSMSFFVNAGVRFVTELCKMIAFAELWDEICAKEYGITDPKARRFRYGVQVNSLGLTEQQPENNVYRILLSMLAVVLSKNSRARAVQLPAWNEALGLPRPWDQQWSLRLQQIVALETDLLEYEDIFQGSKVIRHKVDELKAEAKKELKRIAKLGGIAGGIAEAVESGYMKSRLVASGVKRLLAIENEEIPLVGVNCYTDTLVSPLSEGDSIQAVDAEAERAQINGLKKWRQSRDDKEVVNALKTLRDDLSRGQNIMPATIKCAEVGVTTGEWSDLMRGVFGEYRAPTGIAAARSNQRPQPRAKMDEVRSLVDKTSKKLGQRLKILVGKPGLDGHSNGAEFIALRARDAGFEVVYQGIRLTPQQIVSSALEEGVHAVGLSILSGSHIKLVDQVMTLMKKHKLRVPLFIGGIIPPKDATALKKRGVAEVFTAKDFEAAAIIGTIAEKTTESVLGG